MKTILVVTHEDTKDTVTVRVVQGAKYGDTDTDLTSAERAQVRNLVKRVAGVWKGKAQQRTLAAAFAPKSYPPSVRLTSQWTWDHIVQPVVRLFKGVGK